MNKLIIPNIVRFVLLVLAQILFMNHLSFYGFLTPYIYVMFILLLPLETKGWALLLFSFLIGITIDLFSGTLGLHASASVFTAFIRPLFIKLEQKPEHGSATQPSYAEMGARWFIPYSFLLILIHHAFLNFMETFTFSGILHTLLRIIISSVVTFIIILSIEYIAGRNVTKKQF